MISRESLKKIARLTNLKPWQQEKHYIQALVLIALSEHPVAFKGGTCLWFFHGLNRFSEDLDFTATGSIRDDIDMDVSESLRLFGVENTIKNISDDDRSFSFRINAKGPLNTSDKDLCRVYVEISRRENLLKKPLALELNYEPYMLPVKIIGGMALEEIAAEKVRAIYTRNRARDAYDLHFLIEKKKVKFDSTIASEKLDYYGLEYSNDDFVINLGKKDKSWKKELTPVILGRLPDFKKVESAIRKWIK